MQRKDAKQPKHFCKEGFNGCSGKQEITLKQFDGKAVVTIEAT
ncbi:hypothetical protein ACE1CI_05505 [Aerosakkonemataceae cyanobacterium BLCC-F50]|uniref:Uncharacterized protein n=1 Tax=Floridaenema flaviceps BLCC-F50 TaxID=3153642 RepID=A0ABV4XL27_9CYAN